MEGSKLPNKEYPYFFIKLGKLYYVNESCRNVKGKRFLVANLQMMNWSHFPLIHCPLRNRPQMNVAVILYLETLHLKIILTKKNVGVSIYIIKINIYRN